MEEKLRDHLREAGVINGILMICVLIAQLLGIGAFEHGIMDSAAMICALLAYASGICYTFKGYEKRAANFYKLFMLLYALSAVCTAAVALEGGFGGVNAAVIAIDALCFLGVLLLALGLDLGKRRSTVLALVIFGLYAASLLLTLTMSATPAAVINAVQILVIAGNGVVLVVAKYLEKTDRILNE